MEAPEILKTYKLFIGGQFPRSESGHYMAIRSKKGRLLANASRASRKDLRNAVEAARAAQPGWYNRSAYNRAQIIYRIAELLQEHKLGLTALLQQGGISAAAATAEFDRTVEYIVYMAGWCDKFQALYSAVNPVAGSYFNFSVPEPMGVVAAVAPGSDSLLGLCAAMLPAICGGNSAVVLASERFPLPAIALAEVLAVADMPAGVVNVLSGHQEELLPHMAAHMDINALSLCDVDTDQLTAATTQAADNLKRVSAYSMGKTDWNHPERIMDFQETKTTWHPVESIAGTSSAY